jgi:ArsR family transcriptional regulator
MAVADLQDLETLFLALGDKTRLRLLGLMANGPVAVGSLAEKLRESQPKVSRHLAYLRNAGVVSTERDGKHIYYRIETPADEGVNDVLGAVIGSLVDVRPAPKKRRAVESAEHREQAAKPEPDSYAELDDTVDDAIPVQSESETRDELEVFLL